MTWLFIIKTLLSIVSTIVETINREKLMALGADSEIKRQLEKINEQLGIATRIEKDVADLPDDDLANELSKYVRTDNAPNERVLSPRKADPRIAGR